MSERHLSRGKPVVKLTPDGTFVARYASSREAARANHISYQTVNDYCHHKRQNALAPDGFCYVWEEEHGLVRGQQRPQGTFKDIPDFEGCYQINHHGEVRKLGEHHDTPMKPRIRRKQWMIRLRGKDGTRKEYGVRELMRRTFFPMPPAPEMHFCHKDGSAFDNFIGNLKYVSHEEFIRKQKRRPRRKPVAKLTLDGEVITFYPSAKEAAEANYINYWALLSYCNGKRKRADAPDGCIYAWENELVYDNEGNARLPKRRRNHHDQRNANQQL